jgi:hypothetical protein
VLPASRLRFDLALRARFSNVYLCDLLFAMQSAKSFHHYLTGSPSAGRMWGACPKMGRTGEVGTRVKASKGIGARKGGDRGCSLEKSNTRWIRVAG